MSEHGTYLMVKSALEQAEEFGFLLKWYSDGWKMETPRGTVAGVTADELHQWLNGYRAQDDAAARETVAELSRESAARGPKLVNMDCPRCGNGLLESRLDAFACLDCGAYIGGPDGLMARVTPARAPESQGAGPTYPDRCTCGNWREAGSGNCVDCNDAFDGVPEPQDKLKGIRTFTDAAIAAEIAAENGLDTAEAKHLWERYQEALTACVAQGTVAHFDVEQFYEDDEDESAPWFKVPLDGATEPQSGAVRKGILQDARGRCMEAGKCIARGEHTNVEDLILGAVDMVIEYLETHSVPESPAPPPHVWIGFASGVNNVTRVVAHKPTPENGEFFKGPIRVEGIPGPQAAKVNTGDCSTCGYLIAPGRCRLGNDTKRSQCCFHTGLEKK